MGSTIVQTTDTAENDANTPTQEIPQTVLEARRPIKVHTTTLTFYNPEVGQTDRSPRVTASGRDVFDNLVASNIYPFGTKLRFPDLFGDRVFEVQDRMNPRYTNRMDVFLESKQEALRLGIKRQVKVEILEIGNGEKHWAKRAKAQQVSKRDVSPLSVKSQVIQRARVSETPVAIQSPLRTKDRAS